MKTVEEIVRWTSPSVYKRRTTRVSELGGQHIESGQKVTVWEMSANRDEEVFDVPFRFDIAREPNEHVGFGLGTRFCLGANLARIEIRVILEELLECFEGLSWQDRLLGRTITASLVSHGYR
jgi:cytochrome P450